MIKIQVNELGNDMIHFTVFNELNQVAGQFEATREDKKNSIEHLKSMYMRLGKSIFVEDHTFNPQFVN